MSRSPVHVLAAYVLWGLGLIALIAAIPLCRIVFIPIAAVWSTYAGVVLPIWLIEKVVGPARK